jgi:hypothetical protein
MTISIVLLTLVVLTISGAIAGRLSAAPCVRDPSWTYEKQHLSESVVLVRRVPRREFVCNPAYSQQIDATLAWIPKSCGFHASSPFYQAL